jgi:hypothetical protein
MHQFILPKKLLLQPQFLITPFIMSVDPDDSILSSPPGRNYGQPSPPPNVAFHQDLAGDFEVYLKGTLIAVSSLVINIKNLFGSLRILASTLGALQQQYGLRMPTNVNSA